MRTSLTEVAQIESWLFHHGDISDRLVIEARILSSPEMKEKVQGQSIAYDIVRSYGREKLIKEIIEVEHKLFKTKPYRSFQDRIQSIFKR